MRSDIPLFRRDAHTSVTAWRNVPPSRSRAAPYVRTDSVCRRTRGHSDHPGWEVPILFIALGQVAVVHLSGIGELPEPQVHSHFADWAQS